MTRIVAGAARGRRLVVPSAGTRPTSDRAREAVFSSIESIRGSWHRSRVLDLYAGSGACGLEARSRGAAKVDLVERERASVAAIAHNIATVEGSAGHLTHGQEVRSGSAVQVHRADVTTWISRQQSADRDGFDVVFCDPPYVTGSSEVTEVLMALLGSGLVGDGALVVLERAARDEPWTWPSRYRAVWDRRYGEAHLWIAHVTGDSERPIGGEGAD